MSVFTLIRQFNQTIPEDFRMIERSTTMTEPLDLDFDRLREEIRQEMAKEMAVYIHRLDELDVAEGLLKRQQNRAIPPNHTIHEEPEEQPGPYSHRTQRASIIDILEKEPGLNNIEINARLRAGGYIARGAKPLAGVVTATRHLVHQRVIRRVEPTKAEAARGILIRYYPMDTEVPVTTRTKMRKAYKQQTAEPFHAAEEETTLADSVIDIVAGGPKTGITRAEVVEALAKTGQMFKSGSKYPLEYRITWTLNGLVKTKRLSKFGLGPAALFAKPVFKVIKEANVTE